jgi:sulfite reductase alpha subunit-like flavoprotein
MERGSRGARADCARGSNPVGCRGNLADGRYLGFAHFLKLRYAPTPAPRADGHQTPLLVLYGSNLGTAEGLAHAIAEDASNCGFVVTAGSLDDHVGLLPKEGGVIIVAASYNGQPPDNAAKFCQWLQDPALPADAFAGVEYSVFGCGNRDWAATYQAIPTMIDAQPWRETNVRARRRRRTRRFR